MNFSLIHLGNLAVLVFSLGFYASMIQKLDKSLDDVKHNLLRQRQIVLCAHQELTKRNVRSAAFFLQRAFPEKTQDLVKKEASLLKKLRVCKTEQHFYQVFKPEKSPFVILWPNYKIRYLGKI